MNARALLLIACMALLAAAAGLAGAGLPGSGALTGRVAAAPAPVRLAAARAQPSDSILLDAAAERAAELGNLRGMIVSQSGEVIAEHYFRGGGGNRRVNIKSASKSVLATLVGIAIERGDIEGPDQPISDFFPQLLDDADPRKGAITVGDLLSMRAGLESTSFGNYGRWVSSGNWVRFALARPIIAEPGGRMVYSTGSSHLLSAILTQSTGQSTFAFARDQLAEPLGIALRPWQRDPQGIFFGGNDMYLSPREMLRFGEMYLAGGEWRGQQIVPREWIRTSLIPRTSSNYSGHSYGYGWWLKESAGYPVHFAWGYGGQFVFVVPSLELVAVFVSTSKGPRERGHLDAIHQLFDTLIVPAAEQASASPSRRVSASQRRFGFAQPAGRWPFPAPARANSLIQRYDQPLSTPEI